MYTQEQKQMFHGVGALVLTPFTQELAVDYDAILPQREGDEKARHHQRKWFSCGGRHHG